MVNEDRYNLKCQKIAQQKSMIWKPVPIFLLHLTVDSTGFSNPIPKLR